MAETITIQDTQIAYGKSSSEQALYLMEKFERRSSTDGERDAYRNALVHAGEMISYGIDVDYWHAVIEKLKSIYGRWY